MFETNVFGLARLTQLVLPGMRAAADGLIINIGSMGGGSPSRSAATTTRPSTPSGHHRRPAQRSALLRCRRRPHRPGPIRTNFEETIKASPTVDNQARPTPTSFARSRRVNGGAYASPLMSVGPEAVARVLLKAVESASPRARYLVTPAARTLVHARRLGGDRVWDAIIKQQFKH